VHSSALSPLIENDPGAEVLKLTFDRIYTSIAQ